uniref:Uncharacterized protein n=1 Tax=Siphoviridae sp. ctzpQ31 TaxID=2823613 RepID=A0A8S5L868_9CAUD|nr:MAG TPA: hypothetical protein [Siphoviridae sp. ctzpQ31]
MESRTDALESVFLIFLLLHDQGNMLYHNEQPRLMPQPSHY